MRVNVCFRCLWTYNRGVELLLDLELCQHKSTTTTIYYEVLFTFNKHLSSIYSISHVKGLIHQFFFSFLSLLIESNSKLNRIKWTEDVISINLSIQISNANMPFVTFLHLIIPWKPLLWWLLTSPPSNCFTDDILLSKSIICNLFCLSIRNQNHFCQMHFKLLCAHNILNWLWKMYDE